MRSFIVNKVIQSLLLFLFILSVSEGLFAPLLAVFVTENLFVSSRPRILKEEHLKFYVHQEGFDQVHEVIGFGLAQYYDLINSDMRFKMAYTIDENNYLGQTTIQLHAKDIKFD